MKTSLLKKLSSLMIAPLLLVACNPVNKYIQVPINLDYVALASSSDKLPTDFMPTELTTDDVLMMLETRQDFVIYLYQENCSGCTELARPKIMKFLQDPNNPIKIYSYDGRSLDKSVLIDHPKYGQYFDVTPKIMFFKKGEYFMTLSEKRFTDYKLFSSAMTSFCKKTNIHTASRKDAIDTFLENHDSYLLYLNGKVTVQDTLSKYPSHEFYSDYVYPIMKDQDLPTLVINNYDLTNEYKNELFTRFGFDSQVETWAFLKNGDQFIKYNYLDSSSGKNFIEALNNL